MIDLEELKKNARKSGYKAGLFNQKFDITLTGLNYEYNKGYAAGKKDSLNLDAIQIYKNMEMLNKDNKK